MHLYNAWLPPPVAEETKKETESFSRVINSVKASYKPDDPESVYATLKWISVIDLLVFYLCIAFRFTSSILQLRFSNLRFYDDCSGFVEFYCFLDANGVEK